MADATPESWPAISALLDEALALPAEERDKFVLSLDGERAQHRETLRALLANAAGVETDAFLATLPRLTRVAERGPLTELAADASIGPYRLISELGTGGMGAVWLAERADGSIKRKVALKLPRLTWATGLAERMARERDILASLEHPHIARLYDAGVDQHGRPYLALEYVEGRPIDVYASERGLSVRQKLDLLLQVCAAVSFAHSRLVVHRDLKPSNILVTQDGQVRLLDFGIAKLMEGDRTQETQLTQLSGRALTLDYASPEQIKGEPIGTASDVYSLGVVAYELLTGAKPYKLKRGSAAELEEAIATADPAQASEAATAPQDKKALRGDLDAILNKALKKAAAERYPTIDALAQDFSAQRDGKSITARRDSLAQQARRLVRKRPVETAVVAGIALAVLGGFYAQVAVSIALGLGVLVALWQRRSAVRAADRALADQRRALAALRRSGIVIEFFQTVLDEAGDGKAITGAELIARGEDLAQRGDTDPVARASIGIVLATLFAMRGNTGKAEALMQSAAEAARAAGDRDLLGDALAQLGSMMARGSDPAGGRRLLERVLVDFADDPTTRMQAHRALSFLAQNSNEATAAVHHAEQALALLSLTPRDVPLLRASLIANLAYSLSIAGQFGEALPRFAEAMRRLQDIGQDQGSFALTVRNNWGLAALSGGDVLQAARHFEQAIDISRRSADAKPPLYALANRARVRVALGRYAEALQDAEQVIDLARTSSSLAVELAGESTRIQALRRIGHAAEARAALASALERFDGKVPPLGPAMVNLRRVRAMLLQDAGHEAEAREEIDDLVRAVEGVGLKGGPLASLYSAQSDAWLRTGHPTAARAIAERALAVARAAQDKLPHSAEVGNALLQLARACRQLGDDVRSERAAVQALDHLRAAVGPEGALTVEAEDFARRAGQRLDAPVSRPSPT